MNRIEQTLVWRRLDMPGFDSCYHGPSAQGWRICGTSVFFDDGHPCHLGYAIDVDARWAIRSAHVFGTRGIELVDVFIVASAVRGWTVNGVVQKGTQGCTELDLGFTPSAQLVTLRRLALNDGGTATARIARLQFPGMTLAATDHEYLRLNRQDLRFRAEDAGVASVLTVDERHALLRHPGRWERHNGELVRLFMASEGGVARRSDSGAGDEIRPTGS